MTTVLLSNGFVNGAMEGLMSARLSGQLTFAPADYANVANVAAAIAAECLTKNAALTTPIADATNGGRGIEGCCYAAAAAAISQQFTNSTTTTDFAAIASQIVSVMSATVAKLT